MKPSLKAFIAISVLLNLLLAGIVIGNVGQYFMGHHHLSHSLREMSASLPEAKRAPFEDTLQTYEKDTGSLRAQLTDARKKAANILKAESFDKDAYLKQMMEVRQIRMQIIEHMANTISQLAVQLSPAERGAMADTILDNTLSKRD